MPLYDTECQECGFIQEQLLKIEDEPWPCPECGGDMETLITGVEVFEFKGDGTYDKGITTHGEGKEENP